MVLMVHRKECRRPCQSVACLVAPRATVSTEMDHRLNYPGLVCFNRVFICNVILRPDKRLSNNSLPKDLKPERRSSFNIL